MFDDPVTSPDTETKRLLRFPLKFVDLSGATSPMPLSPKPSGFRSSRVDTAATCRRFEKTRRGVYR